MKSTSLGVERNIALAAQDVSLEFLEGLVDVAGEFGHTGDRAVAGVSALLVKSRLRLRDLDEQELEQALEDTQPTDEPQPTTNLTELSDAELDQEVLRLTRAIESPGRTERGKLAIRPLMEVERERERRRSEARS